MTSICGGGNIWYMVNINGAPDNTLDFDPNANYLEEARERQSEVIKERIDPSYEQSVLGSVAQSIDTTPDTVVEAHIAEIKDNLGVVSLVSGESQAEGGADEVANSVYAESEERKRQERIAKVKESYLQQLRSSPRYQELFTKYSKPTEFFEGTMKVKEQSPDPSFGKALSVEDAEAPNFPGAKIINFEKNGKITKYALSRNQFGELQGSEFTLQEKSKDPNSQAEYWNNSQSLTRNASLDTDRFRVGPTYQVHDGDLEEMEAFLKAREIDV